MKFSCDKYVLQQAAASAARAAAPKSPIAALEGLLLEAGADLRITGYDLLCLAAGCREGGKLQQRVELDEFRFDRDRFHGSLSGHCPARRRTGSTIYTKLSLPSAGTKMHGLEPVLRQTLSSSAGAALSASDR